MKILNKVCLIVFFVSLCAASISEAASQYVKNGGQAFVNLPQAQKKGTLYYWFQGNIAIINPLTAQAFDANTLFHFIYANLLGRDYDTGDYFPLMAESLDISKDKKTYTFKLRKDATWEDGTPITADDAEYTFQKLMDTKVDAAQVRIYFAGDVFKKIDDRTFSLYVPSPNINTITDVCDNFILIQKKQFVNEPDFNKARGITHPVTSGPYAIKEISQDEHITLTLKKDWWGFKIPQMKKLFNYDTIVFRIVPDSSLAYEKFIKGDIDVLDMNAEMYGNRVLEVDKDKVGSKPNSGKRVWAAQFKTNAPELWNYIGWNMKHDIFASKKTRQALGHLIDYDQINQKVYHNLFIRCTSPFGSLTPNADPAQRKPGGRIDYDLKKAIALLKEDGWADTDGSNVLSKTINGKKTKFEFTIRYNSENPMRAKIAQLVKEDFKKAGIIANVQAVEFNALLTQIDNREYDAVILGWGRGDINPDAGQVWATKSWENKGSNFVGYSNPEVDALIEQSRHEFNSTKRQKIMAKISHIIYDDQPYAFLNEQQGFFAGVSSKVKSAKWALKYDDVPPIWMYSSQ